MTELKNIIDTSNSILPTLSSRAMFWRPRYLEESEWLEHIPFYFWLTEALEPANILETEMSSASSYFAFCQAVDKLNLDTLCHATLSNTCNHQQKINDYNHEHYQEFSLISEENSKQLINDYEDRSIDLLLLKYNDSILFDKALMDKWQKKLSQKSVVLVHGSQKKELKPICRKLKDTYPTFEFTHGNGLLLVCFGQEQTARVQSLCNRGSNDSSNRVLHDVYRRLGSACYEGWLSQTSKARQKQLNDKIIQQQEKLLSVDSEKTALLAQLKEAEKQRIHIEENLSSLADEKTSFEQQLSSVKNEAHRSQQKIETLSSNIEQLKQQDSKNRAEKKALEDSVSTRFDELAELTKLLHQSDQDKIALEKDQQKLKADLSQTLQSAKQDKASLESTYQETKAELSQAHKAIEQLKTNKNKKPEDSTKIDGEKDLVITKLQENNKLLEEDQAAAARIIEDLKKENQKLERSLNERFDELATLTKILEEKSQISTPLKSEDASIKLNNKQSVSFSFNRLKPISRLSKKQKKDYEFLKESEYFSAKWYLSEYPEVGRSEKEALMHFILVGAGKGYSPSFRFNTKNYIEDYPDVKESGINPLIHYIKFGKSEGRSISNAKN